MEHFEFIYQTDRKSLHTQIRGLVNNAKEAFRQDLEGRRWRLRQLLYSEEKVYEEEFIKKVKSRVDKDINERQGSLLALKVQRANKAVEFIQAKQIQQNMNNCVEIRDELRRKELKEIRDCQLEQILDKERALAKEKSLDEFWWKVRLRDREVAHSKQMHEDCLKSALNQETKEILENQMRQKDLLMMSEREEEMKYPLAKETATSHLKEMERLRKEKSARLLEQQVHIEEHRRHRQRIQQEQDEFDRKFHLETMRQIQKEKHDDDTQAKKNAVRATTLEYLCYIQKMHNLEAERLASEDRQIEEIRLREYCARHTKTEVSNKKANQARQAHTELLRQICEQQERRLREDAEQRENKMLENRFAKFEEGRAGTLRAYQQQRKSLDLQVQQLNTFKAKEEQKFQEELARAASNKRFCIEMAEKYTTDRTDYLVHHPNWIKLASCAQTKVPNAPSLPSSITRPAVATLLHKT